MGDELSINLSAVNTHIAALIRKISARNRVEIVLWAYETRRVDI
ncbi:LuxR C-terminal-related transcriptional regulator [Modestobacter italicus]